MVASEEVRRLSIGQCLLVWVVIATAGWALLGFAGYQVYRTGEDVVAWWSNPAAGNPAVETAGPTEREIRQLLKIAPAAGGAAARD